MSKSMSRRDFEDALAAFDRFFGWTFNVPAIERMEVNNLYQINIYCDNGMFYQFNPDTGDVICDITEHSKDWRH